jgi:hypothetical protein
VDLLVYWTEACFPYTSVLIAVSRFCLMCWALKLQCCLPMEDCVCSKLAPCNLYGGIKFWLYMHPKICLKISVVLAARTVASTQQGTFPNSDPWSHHGVLLRAAMCAGLRSIFLFLALNSNAIVVRSCFVGAYSRFGWLDSVVRSCKSGPALSCISYWQVLTHTWLRKST